MITENQNNLNRNTGCTYFCVNEEHGKHSFIPGFVSFTWLHLSIAILKLFNDTFLPIYRLNLSIYITSCNHVTKSYRNSILLDYIQWIFFSSFKCMRWFTAIMWIILPSWLENVSLNFNTYLWKCSIVIVFRKNELSDLF